jgi:transposase
MFNFTPKLIKMKLKKVQSKVSSSGAAAPEELVGFESTSYRKSPKVRRTTKSEKLLKDMRRNTKRIFNAEQKIIIVMEGIRGETSIAELCRRYGISETTYYKWNKEFIEAGKRRLAGDEARQATSSEVEELRRENKQIKEALGDLMIRFDILKKIQKMREQYTLSEDI